jgi:Family of unknown function (DUF6941)
MRLDTIIVADAAAHAGGKLSILGAWTTGFRPPSLPWSEPFSVVVRAFIDEEDYEQSQAVDIAIEGPGGATGFPSHFEINSAQLEQTRPDTVAGEQHAVVLTTTQIGFQFLEAGLYEVVVRFNGEEVGRYPLPVAPAESPSPQTPE